MDLVYSYDHLGKELSRLFDGKMKTVPYLSLWAGKDGLGADKNTGRKIKHIQAFVFKLMLTNQRLCD